MNLQILQQLPESFQEANNYIALIDQCLFTGFARLNENQKENLLSLARAFSGTPFENALNESLEELFQSQFSTKAFRVLATCRSSLEGALYDSLLEQYDQATESKREEDPELPWQKPNHALLESSEQWLMDIAVSGFRHLDSDDLDPFQQTLENLRLQPEFIRHSVLLTGFVSELTYCSPISSLKEQPLKRWGDMWSRAFVTSCRLEEKGEETELSGELHILGTDIAQHSNFVRLTCYALLQGDENTAVTINLSTYKVDTIAAENIWKLFSNYPKLMQALSESSSLKICQMAANQSNALLWNEEKAESGDSFSPFDFFSDYQQCRFGKIPAAYRHPAQISEPLFLEGKVLVEGEELFLKKDVVSIKISTDRLSSASPLEVKNLKKAKSLFGLMRFDAGTWTFHPLAIVVLVKKLETVIHNGAYALGIPGKKVKKNTDPVEILGERASRLLRK